MRKFKLIKEFPGSPKLGTIIEPWFDDKDNSNNYQFVNEFLQSVILNSNVVENNAEYFEEPLFYSNEDEVYLDGKSETVYNNDYIYQIAENSTNINAGYATKETLKFLNGFKYFKSEKAAEDYIKLQKAIGESGLKVGDVIHNIPKGNKYYSTFQNKWATSITSEIIIERFIVFEEQVCIVRGKCLYLLEELVIPKLKFGSYKVEIHTLSNTSNKRYKLAKINDNSYDLEDIQAILRVMVLGKYSSLFINQICFDKTQTIELIKLLS